MVQPHSALDQALPTSLTLDLRSVGLTDDQLLRLCADNEGFRFEITAQGELLIMSPTGTNTGRRNSKLTARLENWTDISGTGVSFDSSTMFALPNGARRSPDASWVSRERWESLSEEEQEGIAPLCPDFVVELCSPTDRLTTLQEKMEEYIENGAQLGWLLDAINRRVFVYRPDYPPECLENPATISGDPLLIGFVLRLSEIW